MKKHIYLLLFCWFWGLACYAQTPQKITYTYDALNRLTQVTYLNGSGISYNYDVLGNRNSVVIVGSCAVATATLSGTQTITAGQSATLSVALTGASPWSLVVNGITYSATVSPYTFSVSPGVTTTYTISSVSNSCGAGTVSGSAVVTVNPVCTLPTATLSGTQTITAGQTATLSVALTGASPWSVVVNGVTYNGIPASPSSFTLTPVTTTTYTISSVSNSCGAGTFSGTALVTVNAYTQMYTTKTGNWNDPTVWSCGRTPTSTDVVTIKANHFITIPSAYTANAKNTIFESGGKIIEATNTSKLCLSCPEVIPTNGLIAYYPFNGNANDASGNSRNGTIVGSVTSIADRKGVINSAYQFSGVVLNYISIPDNASLCSNTLTLNAWVNFATTEGGYVINKGRDIFAGSYNLTTGGTSGVVLYNGVNGAYYSSVPTNQWVMITGIIIGNSAKYYVNGVQVSSATLRNSFNCSSAGNPLTIGNHYYTGVPNVWAYPFKGKIDDVRIYNRALSATEVQTIYDGER